MPEATLYVLVLDSQYKPSPTLSDSSAHLANYTFGVKEAQPEEDPSVAARLKRLENDYEEHGMRRSVEAVLVVHEHNHPHVLMLQIANAFFKLPGHYIPPGVSEVDGLKAILNERLGPEDGVGDMDWDIGECLSTWWRPSFEQYMVCLKSRSSSK
ncbi:hypothetical protein Unana1_06605 [Umbelopsis nana]